MKRSEMVTTLAIELMSRLPEWEKQERLNFASELLQCMEIEGMLPPSYKKKLSREEDNDYGTDHVSYYTEIDVVQEWEPEVE